jgi:hypothetical protein
MKVKLRHATELNLKHLNMNWKFEPHQSKVWIENREQFK